MHGRSSASYAPGIAKGATAQSGDPRCRGHIVDPIRYQTLLADPAISASYQT